MPLLEEALERRRDDPTLEPRLRRQLQLAVAMGAVPADYFEYYYFTDEVLGELRGKPTTRAEDIIGWSGDYWHHYEEQARSDDPVLDPSLSRGGIHELELAIDVMDAIFNDKDETHPVNMPNAGGALPGFPEDLVVEVLGRCHAGGIDVLPARPLPRHVRGLVEMLGEYQALAAETAWQGMRADGIRALAANPLVRELELAERLYDALADAHRDYLPDRLLPA
jgi:6-phospho-beta-glucosidase